MNTIVQEDILINHSRDSLITQAGFATINNRYLQNNESPQDMFKRIAMKYSDNIKHAQRLYDYFSKHYAMPATPILSNGGTNRGLPISCFLNETSDSLKGIIDLWTESSWLAASGGGVGSYFGEVREIGSNINTGGKTSGTMPFLIVLDAIARAISQGGSLRRGSIAVYLPVWHPEIKEFIQIRRPTGGDLNRKALNIHHGVIISDEFMLAVEKNSMFPLRSPKDNSVIETINARELWIEILTTRLETGEPYLIFIDSANNSSPKIYKDLNLKVKTSNLCSEIMLSTGPDYLNNERTAVCCLSSLNLEYFDEWESDENFIHDMFCFIDNVIQDFIDRAPESMSKARYSAGMERSVGIGVMGFAGYLQKKMIAIDSDEAKKINDKIFSYIKKHADISSQRLAKKKGPCPDAMKVGLNERFTHKIAIAPTASISIIAGNASPGIEPFVANAYTQKTLAGSLSIRNKFLKNVLIKYNKDNDEVWSDITIHDGSVQHLNFLTQHEKNVFKTAYEIKQDVLIDLAVDRGKYVCQGQSLNLFIPADIHKKELHKLHFSAWKKGLKSLYYCRSRSIQRADQVSKNNFFKNEILGIKEDNSIENNLNQNSCNLLNNDDCESCQ